MICRRPREIVVLQADAAVGGKVQPARPAQPGSRAGGAEERATPRLLQRQKGAVPRHTEVQIFIRAVKRHPETFPSSVSPKCRLRCGSVGLVPKGSR